MLPLARGGKADTNLRLVRARARARVKVRVRVGVRVRVRVRVRAGVNCSYLKINCLCQNSDR